MEIISVKCKCCGANLKIQPDATQVKCEYCGQELLIRHRDPTQGLGPITQDMAEQGFYTVKNMVKIRRVFILLAVLMVVAAVIIPVSVYTAMRNVGFDPDRGSSFINGSGGTGGGMSGEGGSTGGGDNNETDPKIYKTAGQYKVGKDMPAGEYVLFPTYTAGSLVVTLTPNAAVGTSDFLYIQNFPGRQYLRVRDGEYVKLSLCDLYKIEDAAPVETNENGAYEQGQYRVGTDIPAGDYILYQSGTVTASVLATLTPYATVGTGDFVRIQNFSGQYYITLRDGQYVSFQRSTLQTVA